MHLVLHRLSQAAQRQRGIKQALLEDGKLTRQTVHGKHVHTNRLIGYVKQSEDGDEKDDQRAKRRARHARRKGMQS